MSFCLIRMNAALRNASTWSVPRGRRLLLVLLLVLLCGLVPRLGSAYAVLGGLDLRDGRWEMVGIKLYNYNMLPLQEEIGNFALSDLRILLQMQELWDGPPMFDDHCEWHYALKLYRNQKLVRTLRINLSCGYVTHGVLSYHFEKDWFTRFRAHFRPQPWATLRFTRLDRLRRAIDRLKDIPGTYFYHDLRPYAHDGYFALGVDGLSWDVERDSVVQALGQEIEAKTGSSDFFIEPYFIFLDDRERISMRFHVYCSRQLAEAYARRDPDIVASWRSHLDFRDPDEKLELVVIGMTQAQARKFMR